MRLLILNILLFFVFVSNVNSQTKASLFCEVTVNKTSAYVGEPIELNVFVFTSTWFTKGVDPGNIKINGAFTIYFRSISQTKKIDGATFAGVQMIYNIFPYDNKDLIIPEIEINVETPDEGGFKGVSRVVITQEKKINIKPIPNNINSDHWLVADNLTVSEDWIGDITNVKVGDVIERKISISVSGTVSELIPPIVWDTISDVSYYPNRADVKSNKTKTSISAVRNESNRFLFEKEGEVIIPELVFTWWNPVKNKLFKRSLSSVKIDVQPNPNLGIMESIKDSLEMHSAMVMLNEDEKQDMKILGYSIKQFAIGIVVLLFLTFLALNTVRIFIKWNNNKHQDYLVSEKYYFDGFMREVQKGNSPNIINSLYLWIGKLDLDPGTLSNFCTLYGNNKLIVDIEKISQLIKKDDNSSISLNIAEWKNSRQRYLNRHNTIVKTKLSDLNP